jgi:AcrR family transcriptional regulator
MPARRRPAERRAPGRPPADHRRPELRDALLDAAGRLFAERGTGAVSLRRVAAEAGASPAMVHYYFGDKEGLYDALLERTFTAIVGRVQAVLADGAGRGSHDIEDRLADLLRVVSGTLAAEPWIPTLVVREVLTEGGRFRERFVREYASKMAAMLPGLVRSEIDRGRLRPDLEPELAFLSLMGMAVFPFVARPIVERVLDVEYDEEFLARFAEHTRRLFLEGARS